METLERGDVFFFYRPKVEERSPSGAQDVQRFYMVLAPEGRKMWRLIIIGRKQLPDIRDGGQRMWGFVQRAAHTARQLREELQEETYQTKTRGKRHVPPARPAGEGVYRIVRHGDHTHLVYELELPKSPDEVQEEFRIEPEGSYILQVKNPQKGNPPQAGLSPSQKADLPKSLQDKFEGRKFWNADPPRFLNHEGIEIVLIGAKEDVSKELGIELDADQETRNTADTFKQLKLDREKHPVKPLLEGEWD